MTSNQINTVFRIFIVRRIPNIDEVLSNCWSLETGGEIADLNNLSEELIDPTDLKTDPNLQIAALGNMIETYQEVLSESNLMDFSAIQTEAYLLLRITRLSSLKSK